jgi:hypothetical protein
MPAIDKIAYVVDLLSQNNWWRRVFIRIAPPDKRAFFTLSISQIRASSGPFDLIERDGEDPRTLPFLDRRAAPVVLLRNVAVWLMNGAQVTQFAQRRSPHLPSPA